MNAAKDCARNWYRSSKQDKKIIIFNAKKNRRKIRGDKSPLLSISFLPAAAEIYYRRRKEKEEKNESREREKCMLHNQRELR